jgi:hypothetical protein
MCRVRRLVWLAGFDQPIGNWLSEFAARDARFASPVQGLELEKIDLVNLPGHHSRVPGSAVHRRLLRSCGRGLDQ